MDSSGILHIGAHRGTEASAYDWLHKKVLWIEANPAISEDLSENINKYFDQKYICALVGDENKKNVDFYISNNDWLVHQFLILVRMSKTIFYGMIETL